MRRIICMFMAVLLCVSLAVPALAAQNRFVPSISYKGSPEIVPVEDNEGNMASGVVRDADGKIIDYFYNCLEVTSIPEAQKGSTSLSQEGRDLLLRVYKELKEGTMELPYAKFKLASKDMVIRELVDISWTCQDEPASDNHPEIVAPKGTVFEVILNLGVARDVDVYVMTYKNDEWNPIVKTVNNGDGTVTCTFEDLCPVAFAVNTNPNAGANNSDGNPKTGDQIMMWVALLAVSVVALGAVVVISRKKRR